MVTIQIATSSISVLYMRSWLLNIVVYHLFLKKKSVKYFSFVANLRFVVYVAGQIKVGDILLNVTPH